MKFKTELRIDSFLLTVLLAAGSLTSVAEAQQLPGTSIMVSPRTRTIDGKSYRQYFTSRWLANSSVMAALVSNAVNKGTVPSCTSFGGAPWIQARAQIKIRIFDFNKIDLRSCSTSLTPWPPTGQDIILTTIPGIDPNKIHNAQIQMTIALPLDVFPQPWVTEWSVW